MRKTLAVFFAAVTVFALMTANAFAAETFIQDQGEGSGAAPVVSGAEAAFDAMPTEINSEYVVEELSPDSPGALQVNGLDDEASPLGRSTLTYIDKFGVVVSSKSGDPKELIGSDASWQVFNRE